MAFLPSPVCRFEDGGNRLSSEPQRWKLRFGSWLSSHWQLVRCGRARQGSLREGLGLIPKEAAPKPSEGSFWRDGDGKMGRGPRAGKDGHQG